MSRDLTFEEQSRRDGLNYQKGYRDGFLKGVDSASGIREEFMKEQQERKRICCICHAKLELLEKQNA